MARMRSKTETDNNTAGEDAEIAFGEPAVLCNWFVLTRQTIGLRLALGERPTAQSKLRIRGAYLLSHADAVALRELLERALSHSATSKGAHH